MAEWTRTVNTTTKHYMKGVETFLTSKQIIMAAIKKEGGISYNERGTSFDWAVEYKQAPLNTTTGEDQIVPAPSDYVKRPELSLIGYQVNDVMTYRQYLMNGGGPSQLINYYKSMNERVGRNFKEQFPREFFVDSSASGNGQRMTGLESMFATNGTTTITSGAQRSANAADTVGYPNDTYAGLSTALGNYAGSWATQSNIATTWPSGYGSLSYDFFSPVIVCYNSTAFNGSAQTWAVQCVSALRYGITHMQRYDMDRTALKAVVLNRDLYRQLLDKHDSKEQIIVSSENTLRAMGFKDTIVQDGVEITWDFGVPGAVGYGLNFANMEIHSYQDELFKVTGPKYQDLNQSYFTLVRFFGNMKFRSPKHFAKFMTIAS